MSNQQPTPRRRRIAGERRTAAVDSATGTPTATPSQRRAGAGAPPAPPTSGSADAAEARPAGRVSLLRRRESTRRDDTPVAPARPRRDHSGGPAPRARAVVAGGRRLVLGLAALLVVLLLYVGLMLLGLLGTDGVADLDRADQEAAAGRAAQASAERAAGAVLAYDFRTLEEDRDAATRFMTEEYAKDYVGTFDTAVVDAATESKAQVSVEVQGSAVLSASVDKVRVLLFLDQTTLTADAAQPKLALNRVEMIMVEEGDTWKVSDILSF
ncbi:hypothetical protein G7072_15565 [Nocardioides sp. HDW12B]|uniref:hypothetical protein n=1 Tax=Nocardioides sp. HDW12B TaxID=2714939 RepID=UPI00140E4B54|nr:hypothetical protein [Nocardioides sp. HDW12B]QIK67579.1 hypothetical protein G7072_15565 [Nocardioides sp. HDW12B]